MFRKNMSAQTGAFHCKFNEGGAMDFGTVFKLIGFMLWPFLLVFLYYLFDKKGFKRRLEKFKQDGFK